MSESDVRLLTYEQAAKLLGIRWSNVRELVETGQLRAIKVGTRYRIPAGALAELGRAQAV
jgi:excisionase family DNA binding protein